MASNLTNRIDRLERASHTDIPTPWVMALVGMFGGQPQDYLENGQWVGLESLVAGANGPEISGGNRDGA